MLVCQRSVWHLWSEFFRFPPDITVTVHALTTGLTPGIRRREAENWNARQLEWPTAGLLSTQRCPDLTLERATRDPRIQ